MSAVERGSSLDDCSVGTREIAAQHADEHHPTRVRRPTLEEEQTNLLILRRSQQAVLRRLQIALNTTQRERGR